MKRPTSDNQLDSKPAAGKKEMSGRVKVEMSSRVKVEMSGRVKVEMSSRVKVEDDNCYSTFLPAAEEYRLPTAFIGGRIPKDESMRRWPHRYQGKGTQPGLERVQAENHFKQALVDGRYKINLYDDAYVQAEEGKVIYECKVVEMFISVDDNFYFTVQTLRRSHCNHHRGRIHFSSTFAYVELRASMNYQLESQKSKPALEYTQEDLQLEPKRRFIRRIGCDMLGVKKRTKVEDVKEEYTLPTVFIGGVVPKNEAMRQWPDRYQGEGTQPVVERVQARNHFKQALVDGRYKINLYDDAYVQAEEGKVIYTCKVIEMFESVDNILYFTIQTLRRDYCNHHRGSIHFASAFIPVELRTSMLRPAVGYSAEEDLELEPKRIFSKKKSS